MCCGNGVSHVFLSFIDLVCSNAAARLEPNTTVATAQQLGALRAECWLAAVSACFSEFTPNTCLAGWQGALGGCVTFGAFSVLMDHLLDQ